MQMLTAFSRHDSEEERRLLNSCMASLSQVFLT